MPTKTGCSPLPYKDQKMFSRLGVKGGLRRSRRVKLMDTEPGGGSKMEEERAVICHKDEGDENERKFTKSPNRTRKG